MSQKTAAATYTEISRDEMEKFIKRSFHSMKPKPENVKGELAFILKVVPTDRDNQVGIRILTSIGFRQDSAASVGADAIRVQLMSLKDGGPLKRGKAPIVKRVGGWMQNLKKQVHTAIEEYYDNADYWDGWAATRSRGSAPKPPPEPVQSVDPDEDERAEVEDARDGEPEAQAPVDPNAPPIFRGPGYTTEKQFNYIAKMMRSQKAEAAWSQFFSHRPSRQQVADMKGKDASDLIGALIRATGMGRQDTGYGGGGYGGYGNRGYGRRYAGEVDPEEWKS